MKDVPSDLSILASSYGYALGGREVLAPGKRIRTQRKKALHFASAALGCLAIVFLASNPFVFCTFW